MKKFFLSLILISFCLVPAVFAQQTTVTTESEIYYVNVTINRVYPYRMGYVILYQGSNYLTHEAYIPFDWFDGTDSKAELITLRPGREWPSMSVYYLRGEFHHVKLRLRERSHQTWGLMPPWVDIDHYFIGVEEIWLQF